MNARTNPNRPIHLSDDQLDDLLLGEAAPVAAAHLAACPLCQARTASFTSTLAHFNQSSLDWAEASSSGIRRPASPQGERARSGERRLFPAYAWAFAAAMLLLAALLVFHSAVQRPVQTGRAVQPDVMVQAPAAPDPQLAADNMLLTNIDTALNQPDPMPFALNSEPALDAVPTASSESASPR